MTKKRKSKSQSKSKGTAKPQAQEDDTALWQAFARNIDPLELKGRVPNTDTRLFEEMLGGERPASQPAGTPATPSVTPKPAKPAVRAANTNKPPASPPPGQIDTRQVRRIGTGRSGIDARIDLHGMRQSEAHSALRVFLFQCVAKGHRMVLVITGKGRDQSRSTDPGRFGPFIHEGASDRGVLRRNVPLWLAEPDLRAIVVGHVPAHIRHGGDGALYVQLRRRRLPDT